MSAQMRDQTVRRLDEAEGYLMLGMPLRALAILQSRSDWATMQFEASFLMGEALRSLGRYREAIKPLELATSFHPGHVGVCLALGWCYKRTSRLAQAIDALERAVRQAPDEALLHYNLACYWSLAQNSAKAIDALSAALDLDPDFHSKIAAETDFDPIRSQPEFQRLLLRKHSTA